MDKVHYLWLLSSVEAILPDTLSLSYEQRFLAHAHYARSSPPAFPALQFKPFRFANMSAASGRQRCFARCVSVDRCFASCVAVDFLRLQSSTFKCWDVWGFDRWCWLVGAIPPLSENRIPPESSTHHQPGSFLAEPLVFLLAYRGGPTGVSS